MRFVGANKKTITFEKLTNLIISSIIKSKIRRIEYGVAIVNEGVFHIMDKSEIKNFGIHFTYDAHGHPELGDVSKSHIFNNLIEDKNKGITNITYNYLNLPVEVSFGTSNKITYIYDALGIKLEKKVVELGNPDVFTKYSGGFIYEKNRYWKRGITIF